MKNVQPTMQAMSGEDRMMERMHVIDAVCEAVEQFGRQEFAMAIQETAPTTAE